MKRASRNLHYLPLLLFFFLLPSVAHAASIQLVGTSTANGTNAAYNLSINALAGGIDTAARTGDLVIVTNVFTSNANGNPGVSTAGFSEINDLFADDTFDTNFSVSYKIMTASPDATVSCNASAGAASSSVCMAYVWRGVDPTTPFDVASTSATAANADDPNCPSIVPITPGAVVFCTGGTVGTTSPTSITWPTTPAGIGGGTRITADAGGAANALGIFGAWGSGAYDPAAWAITSGLATANSWAAMTMALRPSAAIKVTGTLYSDEGSSAITDAGKVIKLVVATGTPGIYSTTTCAGCNGIFEFNNGGVLTTQFGTSTPMIVFVDGGDAIKAVTVTKASSTIRAANITGLNLYQNRLIVKYEATSGTSTTNAEMGKYDGDDDPDIRYSVSGSALSVSSSTELHVWTGKTFAPGGTVTVHGDAGSGVDGSVHIDDSATFTSGGIVTLAGSWTADTGSTFTTHANGVMFNATTTGKTIAGELLNGDALGSTTFNGLGGGWTFSNNASTTNFRIAAGTVVAPSLLSISGDYLNNGSFTDSSGTVYFSGTTQTIAGTLNTAATDFAEVQFIGSGTKTFSNNASTTGFTIASGVTIVAPAQLSLSGNYQNAGSFTDSGGTVYFNGTTQTIAGTMNTATTDFASTTFLGSGTKTFSNNASTTNFTIQSGSTVAAPALLTVTNFANDGSFTDSSGTVYFTGGDTLISGTLNTATTDFASVVFLGSADIDANASTTNFTITSGTVVAPALLSISGNYSNSGSFADNGGTVFFTGTAQNISGTMNTASTDFASVVMAQSGPGNQVFVNNASTTNFSITTVIANVTAPALLTISGNFTQNGSGAFDHNNGTVFFDSSSPQALSGTMIGNNFDFNHVVFSGSGAKTFSNNASTSNSFTIFSGATVVAPSLLSIAGNYSNSGDFTGGSGTVYLSGSSQQTLSGGMIGTADDFNDLTILNTSGTGGGTQSIVFANSASTTGTFTMAASTSAQFLAGGTYTFPTLSMGGISAATRTWLRSSSADTLWNLVVTNPATVSYVDVKDSSACGGVTIDADDTTNFDSGGNFCWDFTPPVLITVSGTLYSDEGSTAITTAGGVIKLAIGTSTVGLYSTTTCSGCGGLFSFSGIDVDSFGLGVPFLAWVGGNQALRAASLTKASSTAAGANIQNLDLYQNRLVIKHEATAGTSTTNVDLGAYDGDNDSDIRYSVSGSALSVSSSTELHVWTGKTFAPGGTVTVHGDAGSGVDGSVHIDDSATFTGGGIVTLAGSWQADTGSTFTTHANGVMFNASTTGKTLSGTLVGTSGLGSTTFNGSSGGWTFSNSASTTNFRVAAGTVVAPALLSVSGDYLNNGSFTDSGGTVYFSGTTQAISGTLNTATTDFASTTFLGAGTKTIASNASTTNLTIESGSTVVAPTLLTVSGNYSNSGTFTHNSGTVFFAGGANKTIAGTLTGTSAFNDVVIGPSASTTWSNNASTTDLTITSTGSTTAPAFLSIAGDYSNSGSFNANSGTVIINSANPQTFSGTMNGTSAFNNLTLLSGSASATTTFGATTTVAGTFMAAVPNTRVVFPAGATSTLQNLTVAGVEGNEVYLHGSGSGTVINAVNFDGTNDSLVRGADMTGAADSKMWTLSVWVRFAEAATSLRLIGTQTRPLVQKTSGDNFRVLARNSAGTDILNITSTNDLPIGSWVHILFSIDMSDTAKRHLYINDIADLTATTYTNDTIDFTHLNWAFGSGMDGSQVIIERLNGDLADFWHAPGTYIDLSVEANRRKFITADGSPVFLGSSGELPTGASPLVYLSGATTGWETNKGTGGGFTENGALTDGTSPGAYPASQWKLDVPGTRSVNYANVKDSRACTAAGDITANNSTDGGNNVCWNFPVTVVGELVLADHAGGQIGSAFTSAGSFLDANVFAFQLIPISESVEVSNLVGALSGVRGIETGDITNAQLFIDYDADKTVDVGDTQVGGSGSVNISDGGGTVSFSSSFIATTSRSYILQADIANIADSDEIRFSLPVGNITASGVTSFQNVVVTGGVSNAFHFRAGVFGGGGGGGGDIDNTAPPGQGQQQGGDEGGGGGVGGDPPPGDPPGTGGGGGGGGEVYAPLPRTLALCKGDLLCAVSSYFLSFRQYNR